MTTTHEHTAVFMCFPARSIDEEDHYIRGYKRNLKFILSERKKKKGSSFIAKFIKRQFNQAILNMRIKSEHDARLQPEIPGRTHRGKGQISATSNIKKK